MISMRKYRPFFAELYERGGKSRYIPVNPTFRELLSLMDYFGIKDEKDEETLNRTGRLISRLPESLAPTEMSYTYECDTGRERDPVLETDEALGALSEERANAVIGLCDVFDMPFESILTLIEFIKTEKEAYEIYE